ncbi:MAG TPA: DUF448 domain-containing protein [Geomobilimonas sp.]|nr:DUF448 domain-containing protein [Geomobilimonas sp.]
MNETGPQRSCIGCRTVRDKRDLLRFVLAPDRTLVPDLQGKLPGRGAYTCVNRSCLLAAATRNQFSRVFKGEVRFGSPAELADMVVTRLEERIGAYLALANKAGKVASGTDNVLALLKRKAPGLVFIADDLSPDSREKIARQAEHAGVALCVMFPKERLGQLLGKELRGVVAIEQGGFIAPMRNELNRYRNFLEGGAHT